MRLGSPRSRTPLRWLLASALLLCAGCVTKPPVTLAPGASLETLRTGMNVAVTGGSRNGSGRGYLIFKRPDRLHVALLSPFGSSVFELFGAGDEVTCLLPGSLVAYRGPVSQLAGQEFLAGWRLMRWVLARPPVAGPSLGSREIDLQDGRRERVFFSQNGLVSRKVTEDGEEVQYREYRMVDGVAFADRVELVDRFGQRIRIDFDDPQVNQPIEEEALVPRLDGYEILPLAAFRGAP